MYRGLQIRITRRSLIAHPNRLADDAHTDQAMKNIAANPVTMAPTAMAKLRGASGKLPSEEIVGEVVSAAVDVAGAAELATVEATIRRSQDCGCTCDAGAGCTTLGSSNDDTELPRFT